MANIATNGIDLFESKIITVGVDPNKKSKVQVFKNKSPLLETDLAVGPLLGDVIAVDFKENVCIVARVGSGPKADTGYVSTGKEWKELGRTAQLQSIAWNGSKFLCALVGPGGKNLIIQNIDATIINTIPILPNGTSEGILYYNDPIGFIIADTKPYVVGKHTLFKPIRRYLKGVSIYCGQKVGNPDILFITNDRNSIAFKAGTQPKYPQFVVIGEKLVVNGSISYSPPYPKFEIEPPKPEPTVGLPTKVNDLWKKWNAKFPCPLGEDNIRLWMVKFCEQAVFTYPNEGFGTKSADANRPISKDTISQVSPPNAANAPKPNDVKTSMRTWDMVQGAGTTNPKPLFSGQSEIDTSNQFFRKVSPVNHLGDQPPPPPPPPPTNSDRAKLIEIRDDLIDYLQ